MTVPGSSGASAASGTGHRAITSDPGSFRDPDSGILLSGEYVYRYFSAEAASAFEDVASSGLLSSFVERGHAIESTPVAREDAPEVYGAVENAELVVQHPRLPFISYPYEWPFEMLRAAALLQLEMTRESLERGFVLKDATPYNFQFAGTEPLLIDIGSFERYEEGSPWVAYSQFCRTFLNPLLLQAFTGVPFQPWLRSSLEGIDPGQLSGLLPMRRKFRRSVFLDVVLHATLNRRAASKPKGKSEDEPEQKMRPIPKAVIMGTLSRLEKAIRGLKRPGGSSNWLDYETNCHYEPEAIEFKDRFVEGAVREARPEMLWDLGCNTGRYSEIAAKHARNVLAIDSDEATVGAVYERMKGQHTNVLPLVEDLLNPSPGQGWAHSERRSLAERGPADFALALALVHHLAIGGNVPLGKIADWLADVTKAGIVEFVPKEDPMVRELLRYRRDVFATYSQETFESELQRHFEIKEVASIPGSRRLLYLLGPK